MMTIKWHQIMNVAAMTAVLAGAPTQAHHSFAMYDNDKVVTVDGTVKEFQWSNPHVLLKVEGTTAAAEGTQVWTLELTAPGQLMRNGWSHTTLKPGDKVQVQLHPFKSGRLGGAFMNVTMPDGRKVDR